MVHELENAFESAIYRVHTPRGPVDLRVGDAGAARRLRARLPRTAGADAWVVTPCNPGGRRVAPWINARRRREMAGLLESRGIPFRPAVNLDPAGDWPDEHGVCVWNLATHEIEALARRFGQAAVLHIPRRGPPELVWIDG